MDQDIYQAPPPYIVPSVRRPPTTPIPVGEGCISAYSNPTAEWRPEASSSSPQPPFPLVDEGEPIVPSNHALPPNSSPEQDPIFGGLQIAWQWNPRKGALSSEAATGPRLPNIRVPTVVFVSIPGRLSSTRMFLYDRGNIPLPQGTLQPNLMPYERMVACLNEATCCFKIGGVQDGVSPDMLARFFLRVANIRLAGAIYRSRGLWCVALHDPTHDFQIIQSLHEKYWFTPLGVLDVTSHQAAAEVNVLLSESRFDSRSKGYPRHLMTVACWSPNVRPRTMPSGSTHFPPAPL